MKATYVKSGDNYLPAIRHKDTRVERLYGPPLATVKAARHYARLEILKRNIHAGKHGDITYEGAELILQNATK
jgi:hypothetical protein